MNREHIAGHVATDVNAQWDIEHVTGSYADVNEYQLTIGHTTLTLDPREQADRAQMHEIVRAFSTALNRAAIEHLERDGEADRICPNRIHPFDGVLSVDACCDGRCRTAVADADPTSQRGPHRLGCPAGDRDPNGIEKCRCERVTR